MSMEKARDLLNKALNYTGDNWYYVVKDCCEKALAELGPPEPGEFTKEVRFIVDTEGKDNPLIEICPEIILEACDIIDRLKAVLQEIVKKSIDGCAIQRIAQEALKGERT